jgi:predicted alpha/beta superfamily hydrolase
MKSTLATVTPLIVLLTMLNVKSVLAQQSAPVATSENKPPESSNIVQTSIHSTILAEDRRVIIHLPRNYFKDTAQKHAVMYVLDGTSQDDHTADKITVLSDAALVPTAIVVGLPNTRGNRERDQTPPFMRRIVDDEKSPYGAGDNFLSFMEKELIPFIDSNYRTSGYRTLSGNSRGGLFVLYSLMENPGLFQARFCYSTPVWRFENLMVNKMSEYLKASSDLKGFLYISVGDKETDQMIGGFTRLVDVLKKHRKKQFRWVADYTPYAVHQDNALISTSKGLTDWGKDLKELKK